MAAAGRRRLVAGPTGAVTAFLASPPKGAAGFHFPPPRLKVKDIMVRNPATVRATDTMEHCLLKGQELGVAQFPVVEGEKVVGVISANEIFQLAAHCLGAWERRSGVTLAPGAASSTKQ